jgi:hypothetical protein
VQQIHSVEAAQERLPKDIKVGTVNARPIQLQAGDVMNRKNDASHALLTWEGLRRG